MAGGGFAAAAEGGGVTVPVAVTCLMAASCGLIFGYDIGVSGARARLWHLDLARSPAPARTFDL
jgi:hypothetical protein